MSKGGKKLKDHGKLQENGPTGQFILLVAFKARLFMCMLGLPLWHETKNLIDRVKIPSFLVKRLSNISMQEANVLRDGEKHNINAENLVLGDIIFVKFGDRVPADIRVIEAHGFKVGFTNWGCSV